MRRRATRIAVSVGCWLLIGATANIALTLALSQVIAPPPLTYPGWKPVAVTPWPRPVPATWRQPRIRDRAETWFYTGDYLDIGTPDIIPNHEPEPRGFMQGSAAGFPFRSLTSWELWEWGGRDLTVQWQGLDGLRIVNLPFGKTLRLRCIPVWPGFAFNTIIYAALAWGLWQVPLALRRRRQRRVGQCTRCGYDLVGLSAGALCPECGTPAPSAAASK